MRKRKKKDLFNQSTKRLGDKLTVRTSDDTNGALGYFDGMSIVVKDSQPNVAKFIILMHEILHAVDRQLVHQGITKRAVAHAWITHASPNLLALLAALDFKVPSWRRVRAFMSTLQSSPEKKR